MTVIQEVWNGTTSNSSLPNLTTLYAKGLEDLTSISGLAEIANKTEITDYDLNRYYLRHNNIFIPTTIAMPSISFILYFLFILTENSLGTIRDT